MSLFVGVILVSMFISNYNVQAYSHKKKFNIDDPNVKLFRQLIRELQWNHNRRLFFEARTEAEGDCTADILESYQWNGDYSYNSNGVDTAQRCMDTCDLSGECMGWSYKPATKMCMRFSSIAGVIKVDGVRSGSCVGISLKTKCTETRDGQYSGGTEKTLENIATVQDCMTSCDNLNICFGYLYSPDETKCYLQNSVSEFIAGDGFKTGSCMAPQKRVRLADPIKIFREDSLDGHNQKRKDHCVPALTLDASLNKISQDFANQLAAADVTPPIYDMSKMQTVYFNKGDAARHGTSVVNGFYDEHKYFNFDNPDLIMVNHYPKIIWKSSTKMGVGRAFTSDKQTMFVVTTYDWEGSFVDSYKDNMNKKCT
ncbi:unnamed protein product [Adineta steineri]|uniref:SCP domain-containing protein n=1 Tax=Adineta steineri TaxID=433720 RepID=A0A815NBD0_9BILA|nr:unnamed protein product [Adineta steineri]